MAHPEAGKAHRHSQVSTVRSLCFCCAASRMSLGIKQRRGPNLAVWPQRGWGSPHEHRSNQHSPMTPKCCTKQRHGPAESTPTPKERSVTNPRRISHRKSEARHDNPSSDDPEPTIGTNQTTGRCPPTKTDIGRARQHALAAIHPDRPRNLRSGSDRETDRGAPAGGEIRSYYRTQKRKPIRTRPHYRRRPEYEKHRSV